MVILDRCPRCGGAYDMGYVVGGRGIAWDRQRPNMWTGAMGQDWEWIVTPLTRQPGQPAERCTSCGLIWFESRSRTSQDVSGPAPPRT